MADVGAHAGLRVHVRSPAWCRIHDVMLFVFVSYREYRLGIYNVNICDHKIICELSRASGILWRPFTRHHHSLFAWPNADLFSAQYSASSLSVAGEYYMMEEECDASCPHANVHLHLHPHPHLHTIATSPKLALTTLALPSPSAFTFSHTYLHNVQSHDVPHMRVRNSRLV